jgi:uncharacterized protein YvpB
MSGFERYDTDGDGYLDTTIADLDGDGYIDTAIVDLDADGSPDGIAFDNDGDGEFEEVWTGESGTSTSSESFVDDGDPAVHGEPMAEIEYHQVQPGTYDCAPTSVAMLLSEITGQPIDASSVVDAAWDMGIMHENGMAPTGCEALLESYGVDADLQQGSIDTLRTALDEGRDVIITLDADDLYGNGDAPFADDVVSGHAVVLTGIDDEAGLVYVNDPGFPDGAGVAIPIEQFEDAWADFDNQMIVTQEGDLSSDPSDDHSILDIILLPLTFVVGR